MDLTINVSGINVVFCVEVSFPQWKESISPVTHKEVIGVYWVVQYYLQLKTKFFLSAMGYELMPEG